ncbi:MAG: hypothetical protein ACRC4M_02985 [Mycoplasma sp.]
MTRTKIKKILDQHIGECVIYISKRRELIFTKDIYDWFLDDFIKTYNVPKEVACCIDKSKVLSNFKEKRLTRRVQKELYNEFIKDLDDLKAFDKNKKEIQIKHF